MMEEMIREVKGVKTKIDDIEAGFKSLLKRFNQLFDSSGGCSGDLCSCITFYKGTESQMKDVIRNVKVLENRVDEKCQKDTEIDRKLEQMNQDITYIRGRQDALLTQAGKQTLDSEQKRSNRSEQKTHTTFPKDNKKLTGDGKQHRLQKHSTGPAYDKGSYKSDDNNSKSDDEDIDQSRSPKLREKDMKQQNNHDLPPNHQTQRLTQNPGKMDGGAPQREKQEELPSRKASFRPNVKTSMEVALRHTSASMASVRRQQTSNSSPEVVEQREKEYYRTQGVWEIEAKAEQISWLKSPLRELEAVTTILLVDTSQSMASNDAWLQAKTFVNEYIDGLEQLSEKVNHFEYLSLVTFGLQTRCQQQYTTDFSLIRSSFETLQLGGPSPLYGGLLMANAVSLTPEKALIELGNGMHVYTKIILITDGEPTELCLHRGPDIPDPKQMDGTKENLLAIMEELLGNRVLDIFCVPVGNANTDFLKLLFSREGGRRFLNYKDGSYFSRRLFLSMKLQPRFALFGGKSLVIPRDDPDLTARDFAHMQEIMDDNEIKKYETMKRREQNPYEESNNKRLLPIGSRVRQGPDWTDGEADRVDRLWVNWDNNDEIGQYSYGERGDYGVLPVDEPRIPLPGQPLAVGCVVSTGKDWKSGVAPPDSRGVIIKMGATESGIRKALVRWENGKMAAHSYGDDRIYEITLCMTDTSVPTMQKSTREPSVQSSSRRPAIQFPQTIPSITAPTSSSRINSMEDRNRKNKNKNIH